VFGFTASSATVHGELAVRARITRHKALRRGGRDDAGCAAVVTDITCSEAVALVGESYAANALVRLELVRPNGDAGRRMTLVGRVLECQRLRRGTVLPNGNGSSGFRPHAQVRIAVLSADSALADWLAEMTGQRCSPAIPPIADDVFAAPLGAL